MPVDEKTRRLVWSRSGGRCAFCGERVVSGGEPDGEGALAGEECHIVSSTGAGPRHDPSFPRASIDEVSNLLLLCKPHHRLVHERPVEYSCAALRLMKARHERRVEREVEAMIGRRGQPAFERLTSGAQALAVVSGADRFDFAHDRALSGEAAGAVAGFLRVLEKWGKMGEAVPEGKRLQLAALWTHELEALGRSGIAIYGARLTKASGQGELRIAAIRVFRTTDPIAR